MFSFPPSVALSRSQRTLGSGFHPFGTSGRGNLQGSACIEGDFDSANDLPHVFCYRFFRKYKPREYRFAIAEHGRAICLCLEYVNTLSIPLAIGIGLLMMLGELYC